MWHLINNKINVFIDPSLFAHKRDVYSQTSLVCMFKGYFEKLEPSLCDVDFYHAKYLEDNLDTSRVFLPNDGVELINDPPKNKLESVIQIPEEISEKMPDLKNLRDVVTEAVSLAVEHKCAFFLTHIELNKEKVVELKEKYNLEVVNIETLKTKLEFFTQGFFNYYKFSSEGLYGIDNPAVAHQMTDIFFQSVLSPWWHSVVSSEDYTDEVKERIRSFTHNRYVDILVSRDNVQFYKLQQHIDDVRTGQADNTHQSFQSGVRYHLNYYFYLLFGALDHLAVLTNDLFEIEHEHKLEISFNDFGNKKKFIKKVKVKSEKIHSVIMEPDFQEWLNILRQIRDASSHREMFAVPALLITTPQSELSNEEIDAIIYKDHPPIDKEVEHLFTPEQVQNRIDLDRHQFRVSKMKKGLEQFAEITDRDGKTALIDPVDRMDLDIENLNKLIEVISSEHSKYISK